MIVPMKKAIVLVRTKQAQEALHALRKIGLLHPILKSSTSEDLESAKSSLQDVERAIKLVPDKDHEQPLLSQSEDEARSIVTRINRHGDEIKTLQEQVDRLSKEIARLEPWGDFDPALIADFQTRGILLTLARFSRDQAKSLPPELQYAPLARDKTGLRALIIGDLPASLEAEILDLPEQGLVALKEEKARILQQIREIEDYLSGLQQERRILLSYRDRILENIEFEQVRASIDSLEEAESVSMVTGFVPAPDAGKFRDQVLAKAWGIVLHDPGEDDEVPTLIKNPRFVSIIQPIFDLLGTVPGYREKDISFWFLLFFMPFFAMIMGDAGYGALMFLVSIVASLRSKAKKGLVPDILILFSVLSVSTLVWGAITGNWFSLPAVAKHPFFAQFIIPSLNGFDPRSTETVQLVCFVLGTVQLVLAHTLDFISKIRQKPHIHAFAQLGWLTTILGLYYLVLNLVISNSKFPVPEHSLWMIVGGMIVVFLFENQEGDGFFKGVLRSLANFISTALGGVSAFADIISYIRLFAVGLSGAAIAQSFNGMVQDMFSGGAFGIVAGILVLLLGHSLNLAMAVLSVIVHGVRLNMLEFSGHVGNEWAGFAYKPFAQKAR